MPDQALLVASPYLQAVIPVLAMGLRSTIRHQLREDAEPELIYDALNQRAIALDPFEHARLRAWRRAGGRLGADETDLAFFRETELVMPVSEAFRRHRYDCVEIEINRHCNFRCGFCPVKDAPKPRAFMPRTLFVQILDRVKAYGASQVSLHHYSEPTLDPDLIDKVALAAERGLKVRMHSNASLFDEDKIRALAQAGNVTAIVVNLPSVDPDEHARVTKSRLFDRVIENLGTLHRYGLPVFLSINVPRDADAATVDRINERFGALFGTSTPWWTTARAGMLDAPEYADFKVTKGLLDGCMLSIDQLNVSYEGKAFLCCMDYNQTYILGDLTQQSLREVAESDAAAAIRRKIFGFEEPPEGFICSSCDWTGPRDAERFTISTREASRALLDPSAPIVVSPRLAK